MVKKPETLRLNYDQTILKKYTYTKYFNTDS